MSDSPHSPHSPHSPRNQFDPPVSYIQTAIYREFEAHLKSIGVVWKLGDTWDGAEYRPLDRPL